MLKKQAGSVLAVAIIVIVFVLIGIGAYYAYQQSSERVELYNNSIIEDDNTMDKEDEVMEDDDSIIEENGTIEDDKMMEDVSFSGTVLAGNNSPLIDFNKADYDKALASDKLVVLYFYASWCPICQAEFPKMKDAFNQLSDNDVVGFRVNFNDNDTDRDEENLAREFGVAYQHTKVFLKNSERVLKAPETWDSPAVYISKINQYK